MKPSVFPSLPQRPVRVIFSGGGTGGHVFPALAVARSLQQQAPDSRLLFVGTRRGLEATVVPQNGYPIRFVTAKGLSRNPLKALTAVAVDLFGATQALWHVLNFRPDVVVGSGGYVSVPVTLAAWMLRLPVLLLEQNVVPGKATRFLSKHAARVCVSFEASAAAFGRKALVTGNPVREEILTCHREHARARLDISPDRPCVLVTGASQGARSVNEAVLNALSAWKNQPWHVLHLTGRRDFEHVAEQARSILGNESALRWDGRAFLDDMAAAYAAADLVVARAGATTIAEITARGVPAVLIPYPHAGAHQTQNARVTVEHGAAILIADEQARKDLPQTVLDLMASPDRRAAMAVASAEAGHPDAALRITLEILRIARGKTGTVQLS